MGVTIADVARLAGVSKATVSRVLNGKPDVEADTAARIRTIIEQTGYERSSHAVGLARGSTHVLGMLVPKLAIPWLSEILQGVVDTASERGYGVQLYSTARGQQALDEFARHAAARSFDGLVFIQPFTATTTPMRFLDGDTPCVLIDDMGNDLGIPTVATTNTEGGRQAARHLLAVGRRRPATITGPLQYGAMRERLAGFEEVLRSAGAALDTDLVRHADLTAQGGYLATKHLLASRQPFDAVFAHNDLTAAGVLRALREERVAVPDDVAVVGFDDIALAALTGPSLTTVRQPAWDMGQAATVLLIDQLQGRQPTDMTILLPTTLVVRESTGLITPSKGAEATH